MAKQKSEQSEILTLGTAKAPVRLSFLHVAAPKKFAETDAGDGKYQTDVLIDPTTVEGGALVNSLKAEITALAKRAYGEPLPGEIRDGSKICMYNNTLADGSQKKEYEGYAGQYVFKASNDVQPVVYDRLARVITPKGFVKDGAVEAAEVTYPESGDYAIVKVRLWAQNNKWGKRINANLLTVQFVAEGKKLSGGGKIVIPDGEVKPLDDGPIPAGQGAIPTDISF